MPKWSKLASNRVKGSFAESVIFCGDKERQVAQLANAIANDEFRSVKGGRGRAEDVEIGKSSAYEDGIAAACN